MNAWAPFSPSLLFPGLDILLSPRQSSWMFHYLNKRKRSNLNFPSCNFSLLFLSYPPWTERTDYAFLSWSTLVITCKRIIWTLSRLFSKLKQSRLLFSLSCKSCCLCNLFVLRQGQLPDKAKMQQSTFSSDLSSDYCSYLSPSMKKVFWAYRPCIFGTRS